MTGSALWCCFRSLGRSLPMLRFVVPMLMAAAFAASSVSDAKALSMFNGCGCGAEPSCCGAERCCREKCCREKCPREKCCREKCPREKCCRERCCKAFNNCCEAVCGAVESACGCG